MFYDLLTQDFDNKVAPNKLMPFPLMLHEMLDDAEISGFANIVSWQLDGYAFKVIDKQQFVDQILPKYFNQNSYKSFLRQVNLYGFSRISKGQAKGGDAGGCYFHKHFIRGQKQLCAHISRQSSTKKQSTQSRATTTSKASQKDFTTNETKSVPFPLQVNDGLSENEREGKMRASSIASYGDYHSNSLQEHLIDSSNGYPIPNATPTTTTKNASRFPTSETLPRSAALNFNTTWLPPSASIVSNPSAMLPSFNDHIVNDPAAGSLCRNHLTSGNFHQDEAMAMKTFTASTKAELTASSSTALEISSTITPAVLSDFAAASATSNTADSRSTTGLESLYNAFAVAPMELDSAKNLLESVDLFKKGDVGGDGGTSSYNGAASTSSDDHIQGTEAV